MKRSFIRYALLLLALSLLPSAAFAKKIELEWKPIKGAAQYEVRVDEDGKPVAGAKVDSTSWSGQLPFGFYTYQLRAIDRIQRPGRWSNPIPLVVMPSAPALAAPLDGSKVGLYVKEGSALLKWSAVKGAKRYRLKVKRGGKEILNELVAGLERKIEHLSLGSYAWQVTAVIEPNNRVPASLQNKKWESEASDAWDFQLEKRVIEKPNLISPIGQSLPPPSKKMGFKWDPVEGAEAYEFRLTLPAKKKVQKLVTDKTSIVIVLPENEGTYSWAVKGIAARDPAGVPSVIGQESQATLALDRNMMFVQGTGFIALSGMLAPYDYRVISPGSGFTATTSSVGATVRLSGEYWFLPRIAISPAFDSSIMTINNTNFPRSTYELHFKYRMALSNNPFGWFLAPKIGAEMREFVQLNVSNSGGRVALTSTTLSTIGGVAGLDIRKQFSPQWSLGAKIAYFHPLTLSGAPSDGKLTSDASNRNISVGLQGFYFPNRVWGFGGGAYLDNRSISYQRQNTSVAPDQIFNDAIYFFGSFVYNFGR